MKLINQTMIALALAAVTSVASAAPAELMLNSAKAGNSHAVSLDFNLPAGVVGLEFKLKVPEGATVDTSRCSAELKSRAPRHDAVCSYNAAEHYVVGMVFSDSNEALPAGLLSMGTISAKSKGGKGQPFEVIKFLAADVNGKEIPSSSKMMREDEGNIQAK